MLARDDLVEQVDLIRAAAETDQLIEDEQGRGGELVSGHEVPRGRSVIVSLVGQSQ